MPERAVDDGFDAINKYCNSQLAWVLTAKNIVDLFQRFKLLDIRKIVHFSIISKDTVQIAIKESYENQVMFGVAATLGILRTILPGVDIDVRARDSLGQPGLCHYLSEKAKCNFRKQSSYPIITIHSQDLVNTPPITRHDVLSAILESTVYDFAYVELGQSDIVNKAKALINKNMHIPDYSLSDLAAEMCTSCRTLQRRFKDKNLTFQKMLREQRRKKAIFLLNEGKYDRSKILEQLGYQELSSLYRLVRKH